MAEEAAAREALRREMERTREQKEAEKRELAREFQKREAQKLAAIQAASKREAERREAERERAKKEAVGSLSAPGSGSFANFGSFNAKRSQAEAHGLAARKAGEGASSGGEDSGSDSEDTQASQERLRKEEPKPIDWSGGPAELLDREQVATSVAQPGAFVEHFARFMVSAWRRELGSATPFEGSGLKETDLAVFRNAQSLQQIEDALGPLIHQLERREANLVVVQQLDKMVSLAAKREYADAGSAYIEMALGHKKWNNTHATYAGAVGQNKGCRTYKTYQDKLLEYDKDPVVQKYIQCMRKLVYFAQCIRPNADVSKHLHI